MSSLKSLRTWAIAVSCCMAVLGILMMIWPGISAMAVCCVMGVFLIAMGACEFTRYFSLGPVGVFFRFDLALGIINVLAGVALIAHPYGALAVLPVVVGLYVVIDSVFAIQTSVEMRRYGLKSWWLALLLGIVGALLGVLLMLDPFTGAAALMIFMGVSLLVSGIGSIYSIICASRAVKAGRPIEAEWKPMD